MSPIARPSAGKRDREQAQSVLEPAQRYEAVEAAHDVGRIVSHKIGRADQLDGGSGEVIGRLNELIRKNVLDAAGL
jgi:hypothetical protein